MTKKSTLAAWRLICLLSAGALAAASAQAQMKVGSNPTTLASDVNLQVEASNGGQVVVRKSSAQVGIGTSAPGNTLEVNSGTASASGLRLTQLPSATLLGTNASGDVVKVTSTSACTCGDIKASILTANHGDWKLMNGSAYGGTNSCGAPVVNASSAVLVMGGSVGTTSAASNLAQNQLPNVALTTDSQGSHAHYTHTNQTSWSNYSDSNGPAAKVSNDGGGSGNPYNANQAFASNAYGANIGLTSGAGGHTHTTSSINGGVTQQPLTTANLPRLNVNYFICVN